VNIRSVNGQSCAVCFRRLIGAGALDARPAAAALQSPLGLQGIETPVKAKRIGIKVLDMSAVPAAHLEEAASAAEVTQSGNGYCHGIIALRWPHQRGILITPPMGSNMKRQMLRRAAPPNS
jgi:hypothetical protein